MPIFAGVSVAKMGILIRQNFTLLSLGGFQQRDVLLKPAPLAGMRRVPAKGARSELAHVIGMTDTGSKSPSG